MVCFIISYLFFWFKNQIYYFLDLLFFQLKDIFTYLFVIWATAGLCIIKSLYGWWILKIMINIKLDQIWTCNLLDEMQTLHHGDQWSGIFLKLHEKTILMGVSDDLLTFYKVIFNFGILSVQLFCIWNLFHIIE